MADWLTATTRSVRSLARPSKASSRRRLEERGQSLEPFRVREAHPSDLSAIVDLSTATTKLAATVRPARHRQYAPPLPSAKFRICSVSTHFTSAVSAS